MSFDNIPDYVKDNAEFCCWRYETVKNKQTKVPYNPRTGRRASVSKPATFTDFATAVKASVKYSGVGIRISNRIIGIDLDHCIKDGTVQPWALAIVQMFPQAYIEISPSGSGLRILCLAPDGYTYDSDIYHIKRGNVEVYVPDVTNRFVTLTDDVYQNGDIVECTKALEWLLDTHMKRPMGGNVSLIGVFESPQTIPMNTLWIKNIAIKMGLVNANRIPELIDLIKEGKLNMKPLITHTLPLSQVAEGYDIFEERRDGAIKVVLKADA